MDLKETLSGIAQTITDKTTEVVELGKLYAKNYAENSEIEALKKQIGEVCIGKFRAGDELDPEIEALCAQVERHKHTIAENQRTIQRMKNADTVDMKQNGFCPYCGEPIVPGAKFCPHCGSNIE